MGAGVQDEDWFLPQAHVVSIIDDDEAVRSATQGLLRSMGYAAHTFASAEDFLASAEAERAACVITDVQMPGMSGPELQRVLCARRPGLPIIFITAFPEDRIREQVMAAGAADMLGKPFDGQALVDCVAAALAAH